MVSQAGHASLARIIPYAVKVSHPGWAGLFDSEHEQFRIPTPAELALRDLGRRLFQLFTWSATSSSDTGETPTDDEESHR